MSVLPYRYARAWLAMRGLWPRTRLARFTALLAVIDAAVWLAARAAAAAGKGMAAVYLGGWTSFLNLIVGCLLLLGIQMVRQRLLWRLRTGSSSRTCSSASSP